MSYPLTPDSPSYQEIALRVAVQDVLDAFDPTYTTTLRSTLSILAPHVEALRIAHADLVHVHYSLRIPVTSFLSAYDFTLTTSPYAPLEDYLENARKRLHAAFVAPDQALVASQEDTLRATVDDFLAAWKTSREPSAPNRSDFPHLPPLPANRLRADWVQFRQTSVTQKRLKQADKALHVAYANLAFAPVHLRLAGSHFLMTFDLLHGYEGDPVAAGPLVRAGKSLKKAFDPTTSPAPSVYRREEAVAI